MTTAILLIFQGDAARRRLVGGAAAWRYGRRRSECLGFQGEPCRGGLADALYPAWFAFGLFGSVGVSRVCPWARGHGRRPVHSPWVQPVITEGGTRWFADRVKPRCRQEGMCHGE
jgi:hypothetical protein